MVWIKRDAFYVEFRFLVCLILIKLFILNKKTSWKKVSQFAIFFFWETVFIELFSEKLLSFKAIGSDKT